MIMQSYSKANEYLTPLSSLRSKHLNKSFLSEEELKWVRGEEEAIIQLDHPNIVNYIDTYQDNKHIFIVTQFVEGETLHQNITRKGWYQELEAAPVFHEICCAINHIHAKNMAHMNLKPQNIIINEQNHIVVVNFGLSEKIQSKKMTSLYLSSPSPIKQVINSVKSPKAEDIYSMGIILYFMLCGELPFEDETSDHLSFDSEEWPRLSDPARSLIKEMLSNNYDNRPSASNIFKSEWFSEMKIGDAAEEEWDEEVLQQILQFRWPSVMRLGSLNLMVQFMKIDEFVELLNEFTKFDPNQDGIIKYKEFKKQFMLVFPKLKESKIREAFDRIDIDGNNKWTYSDFLVVTLERSHFFSQELVGSLFRKFDRKSTERITPEDVEREFKTINSLLYQNELHGNKGLTTEQKYQIKTVDFNNKKSMTFKQFEDFLLDF